MIASGNIIHPNNPIECPPGYTWSFDDNMCVPIPPPPPQNGNNQAAGVNAIFTFYAY